MNNVFLCLGSNQKNPERQIRRAFKALKALPQTSIIKVSNLHWTKAWGFQGQQDFCNAAIALTTRLPPKLLLKKCQSIEYDQGRVRKKRWGPRTLDIDIIFYAGIKMRTQALVIPHPYWAVREFVRKPLSELTLYGTKNGTEQFVPVQGL